VSVPTVLREAREADLPAILEIYNQSVPLRMATADLVPQQLEARVAWFRNRDRAKRPVIVAEQGGEVVGWGSFTNFKDRAAYAPTAEVSVYVAQSHVGRRIGWSLLDSLLGLAPRCGIDRILAICFEHNEPSLRLFRSFGFTTWGTLPDACDMDGTRRTIVILGKSLERAP